MKVRFVGVSWLVVVALLVPSEMAYADEWDADGGGKREQEIVRRYQSILEKNPTRGFAFKQVLSRVGTGKGLSQLVSLYKKRTEKDPETLVNWILLGHFLAAANRYEEAVEAYNEVLKRDKSNQEGLLGRGEVFLAIGNSNAASKDFEVLLNLENQTTRAREDLLRKLADLSFTNRDWESAQGYYDRLIDMKPKDVFLRMEYVDLLNRMNQLQKAEEQLKQILKLNKGNARRLAETYRDLGDLYLKMNRFEDSIGAYEKAMKGVSRTVWLYRELQHRLIAAYRKVNRLPELVTQLEKTYGTLDFDESMVMGQLYEDLGDDEKAYKAYTRAIKLRPRVPEPRLKRIRIVERRGDEKEVIKEYKSLIQKSPNVASYHFDLGRLYIRSGNRAKALALLKAMERQFRRDPEVVGQIADLYVEYDLQKEALALYKQLHREDPRNDVHIQNLGEQYYRLGELRKAVETWTLLLKSNLQEVEAYARLGQVLADHGLVSQALTFFQKALKKSPSDLSLRRGVALAYERAGLGQDALQAWMWITDHADRAEVASEARRQVVRILAKYGALSQMLEEGTARFESDPSDWRSGLLVAQGNLYEGKTRQAEKLLKEVTKQTAGKENLVQVHEDTLQTLLRVYEYENRYADAIEILKGMAARSNNEKKFYYQRIAELSLKRYDSDDALMYAQRVIDANPDDAQAVSRLGDIYVSLGELEAAIETYEKASQLDPQEWNIVYKMAEVQRELGDLATAEENYRRILQYSRDEALVENSARKIIWIATSRRKLDGIEQEMFQLAMRTPRRERFVQLSLSYYRTLSRPLISDRERLQALVTRGPSEAHLEALKGERQELERRLEELGRRVSPILLEGLVAKSRGLRRDALELAIDLGSKAALHPMARIAQNKEDPLWLDAVRGLVHLNDPRAVPTLRALVKNKDNQVSMVGIWALGFLTDPKGEQVLIDLLQEKLDQASGMPLKKIMAMVSAARHPSLRQHLLKVEMSEFWWNSEFVQQIFAWSLTYRIKGSEQTQVAHAKELFASTYSEVQKIAAITLGRFGKQGDVAELIRAYYDATDRRTSAGRLGLVWAMAKEQPSDWDVDQEIHMLSTEEPDEQLASLVRSLVIRRIGTNAPPQETFPVVIKEAFLEVAAEVPRNRLAQRLVGRDLQLHIGPFVLPLHERVNRDFAREMIDKGAPGPPGPPGDAELQRKESLLVQAIRGEARKEMLAKAFHKKGLHGKGDPLLGAGQQEGATEHTGSTDEALEAVSAALFLQDEASRELLLMGTLADSSMIRAAALRALTVRGLGTQAVAQPMEEAVRRALKDVSLTVQVEGLRLAQQLRGDNLLRDLERYMRNPVLPLGNSRAVVDLLSHWGTAGSLTIAQEWKEHPDGGIRKQIAALLSEKG